MLFRKLLHGVGSGAMLLTATAEPLRLAEVSAPAINCVFSPDCILTSDDSLGYFTLPISRGTAYLQSRVAPGQPRSPAEGEYGYLYRVDLRKLTGVLTRDGHRTNGVVSLSLPFGPLAPKDFDDDGSLDDAFVMVTGGSGSVLPVSAEWVGGDLVIRFADPPIRAADSSVFIGLVSAEPPRQGSAMLIDELTGTATACEVRVPLPRADLAPQLQVFPTTGYAGSRPTVTGRMPPGSTGVRITWQQDGESRLLARGPTDTTGRFSFAVGIPPEATPGAARLQAGTVGLAFGETAGAGFEVVPTPPGRVGGRVVNASGQPVVNAEVRLIDPTGFPVRTVATGATGDYDFGTVAPGNYQVQAASDGFFFPAKVQKVSAGGQSYGSVAALNPDSIPAPIYVTFVGALAVPQPNSLYNGSYPVLISDQSSAKKNGPLVMLPALPGSSGSVYIRFWADVQQPESGSDVRVEYRLLDPQNNLLWSADKTSKQPVYPPEPALNFPAYTSSVLISDINAIGLPPGDLTLKVTPFLGEKAGVGKQYTIRMVNLTDRWFNSWVDPLLDPDTGKAIRVLAASGSLEYLFRATLSTVGFLPWSQDFHIPVFNKTLENRIDAGVAEFQESFLARPSGGLYPGVLKPKLNPEIKLFSKTLLNEHYHYVPLLYGDGTLAEYDLPRFTAKGPTQLLNVKLYQNGPGIGCFNACLFGCEVCLGWKVYVDLTVDGAIDVQSHIDPMLRWTGDIIPSVAGTLGGHARVKLAVCNADADITGTVSLQLPVHFQNSPPDTYFDQPCVQLSGTVDADIGCLGIGFGGGGSIGPYDLYGCDSAGAPVLLTALQRQGAGDPARNHDPAPSVAANAQGQALAVWVHQEISVDGQPEPYVYFSICNGRSWSAGDRLTTAPAWVHDPKVAFLADNQALAVWAQNTQPLAEIFEQGMAQFGNQEIYFSLWDGNRWSPGRPLTVNTVVDGVPSLASDPATGQAVAAWTTVIEPSRDNPELSIVNSSAVFSGGGWGALQDIANPAPAMDSNVQVAYDRSGNAWAVWTRDADGDLTTFADRQLLLARQTRSLWGEPEVIPDTPPGAFSPALALDADDQPVVAFLEPPTFQDELTSGTGNRSLLWSAHKRSGTWWVQPVGSAVYAEEPVIQTTPDNRATILFRRFSADDLLHRDGDIGAATASLNLPAVQWRDDYLTYDNQTNWKIAFATAPGSGRSFVVNVKQSPLGSTLPAAARAATQRLTRHSLTLQDTGTDAPVLAQIIVEPQPDLVIEGGLTFSDTHPAPGANVTLHTTIRNQGFAPVDPGTALQVAFFDQDGTFGTPLQTLVYTNGLAPGETATLSIDDTTLSAGLRVLTVWVDAGNAVAEALEENNTATGLLGQMPPPQGLLAVADLAAAAVLLEWSAPDTADLDYFEVWRSEDGGQQYESIGQTPHASFTDVLAMPDVTYGYAITAVDTAGVQSTRSAPAQAVLSPPTDLAAPGLTADLSDSVLNLRWPKLAQGFVLESTGLQARLEWTEVAAPTVILGDQRQVQLPITTPEARFYRLHKP